MAIYAGNFYDPEAVPFTPDAAHIEGGTQGSVLRVSGQRPRTNKTPRHLNSIRALSALAQWWKDVLTPLQQATWHDDYTLTNRSGGTLTHATAYQRWIQVNMPLWCFSMAIQYTSDHLIPYQFRNPSVIWAGSQSKECIVQFDYQRTAAGPRRTVLNVSQVPYKYMLSPQAWRYAIWCESFELWMPWVNDDWHTFEQPFPLVLPVTPGKLAGFYIRVSYLFHVPGPGSLIESTYSTETWEDLTVVATDD